MAIIAKKKGQRKGSTSRYVRRKTEPPIAVIDKENLSIRFYDEIVFKKALEQLQEKIIFYIEEDAICQTDEKTI